MKKKKILAVILSMIIVLGHLPITALADLGPSSFKDMPKEGHWSRQALEIIINNGLLKGFTEKDGIYIRPNEALTRAQLAAIVNRAFEVEELGDLVGVTDVSPSAWYYKDMQKAVKMGTIALDEKIRPEDKVTRQEAFTILGRALNMDNGSIEDMRSFADSSKIDKWAIPAMGSMVREGYVKGNNNLLNPKANMTRAEFAVVMNNLLQIIIGPIEEFQEIEDFEFTSEIGIREYLIGQWSYEEPYLRDITCKMDIDENLNVDLSFENSYSDFPQGKYKGKITLDRMHAKENQAPDLISLELIDADEDGGDFFFLHRTTYDNKRVMSWFFAANGNSIFDVIDTTGDFIHINDEVIFEKISGEKLQEKAHQDAEFHAVYWGIGADNKSMWLDDVLWTPENESIEEYPAAMTNYSNDVKESVLYTIVPEEIMEVLGDELTKGGVYYVETDDQGKIKYFIPAEKKQWIDNNYMTQEIEDILTESLKIHDEINDYLEMGMSILFEGDTIMIHGEEYYKVALGTQHEDHFVRELHYAVHNYTGEVYWYDVLNDQWEPMAMG